METSKLLKLIAKGEDSYGDAIGVPGMTLADLNQAYFREFYEKEYE